MRASLALPLWLITVAHAGAQEASEQSTAILVTAIHDAQIVRGDDGMDHVEYEILVTNVFTSSVTLTSVAVLDPAGEELMRIEGDTLAEATQTLLAQTKGRTVAASGVVSVDVDVILPPATAPDRLSHRIVYAIEPTAPLASIIGSLEVVGPDVAVDKRPAIVLVPPLTGPGWWAANGCCKPNIHRDTPIAIDGSRIETAETFAMDWVQIRDGKMFEGDGGKNEQHYAFGADVYAVGDGEVVSVRNDMPEETPFQPPAAVHAPGDYAGNHVILRLADDVYAVYAHLQPGSVPVRSGDQVHAGDQIGRLGNTGNSTAPHLHFGIVDRPDFLAGRSLPLVFDRFTVAGAVDTTVQDALKIEPASRPVEAVYPLYPGIQDFPE
jgi:Peptidase family M23